MSAILLLVLRLLLAVLLYAFVGWALYIIWRDLRQQSTSLNETKIPQVGLYPQAESNLLPATYNSREVLIGREASCDFTLQDPAISSRHARLFYLQDQWWIEDLNSTNGTYLNDHLLETATVITHGDRLQFGKIEFLVTIDLLKQQENRPQLSV